MKRAFERFKDAATGRWAVALPIYLITVPFGAMVAIERESAFNKGFPLSHHVLITTAGYLASFLYLFTMQATVLKNRRIQPQALWKCIFVWYSTGSVQGLASGFYAHQTYGDGWHLAVRVGMPTFYTGSALALIAFYFGSIERRRIEDEALRRLDGLLSIERGELVATDALVRSQAHAALDGQLRPQIEKLQFLLADRDLSDQAAIGALVKRSEEISSALDRQADLILQSRVIRGEEKASDSKPITYLSNIFPNNLSVRISVVVIAFGAITGQLPRNGLAGVIAGTSGALFMGLLLLGLSRIVKRMHQTGRVTFLVFSYVVVFLGQALWTYLIPKIGFTLNDPYPPFYSAIKTLYGVYIASIISTLIIETSTRREKSKELSERTLGDLTYLAREQEILEHHLFTTRFGTLQGKISGAIMALRLLDSAAKSSEFAQKREFLLSEAEKLLNDALIEIQELGALSAK